MIGWSCGVVWRGSVCGVFTRSDWLTRFGGAVAVCPVGWAGVSWETKTKPVLLGWGLWRFRPN